LAEYTEHIEHRITSVKKKKYTQNCYVWFDYSETDNALIISTDLVVKYGLRRGLVLNDNLFHKIYIENRIIKAKQTVYNYVSYKQRTEKEVRSKLISKGFKDKEIDIAINFLYDFKLLDDWKFAQSYAKDYIKRKNVSANKLSYELRKKGISKYIANQIIDEYYPFDQIDNIIRKAAEKKLKAVSYKPLRKQRESVTSYLQRQGFYWNEINKVLNELWEEKI